MTKTALVTANDAAGESLLRRYAPFLEVIDHYPWHCSPAHPVTDEAELIPVEDILLLRQALQRRLQPATEKERAGFVGMLCSAWPHAHQRTDEGLLDGFLTQLEQDMAEFPPDILAETVRHLRRAQRFFPAISELYGKACELMRSRNFQVQIIEDHAQEHARRRSESRDGSV